MPKMKTKSGAAKRLKVRAGGIVCFDLRFPELVRALALRGIHLLIVPARWPAVRDQIWRSLLKARAIENQCYVLAAAQGGLHRNGRTTHGDSMLVDPWGRVVDRLATGQGIVSGVVDPAVIANTLVCLLKTREDQAALPPTVTARLLAQSV